MEAAELLGEYVGELARMVVVVTLFDRMVLGP